MKKTIFLLLLMILAHSCQTPSSSEQLIGTEFQVGNKTYTIDTLLVYSPEITDTSVININEAKKIVLSPELEELATAYSKIMIETLNDTLGTNKANDVIEDNPGVIPIPTEYRTCLTSAPSKIRDLKDGVIVDAYEFYKGDEKKLGFLGFANVNIKEEEKVTVVEFAQHGSQNCNNYLLKYGVGARLMMRVTSSKRRAKLETPQQITASVIFGQASVKFSMRTFGITGPGVSRLNKVGTVTENTYSNFMSEISNLIVDVYKDTSEFIISPQPLFLKQN